MKNILTIAGFDPSSGAGITKDLDVFFSLGLHGLAVPTCIVNQGPLGVAHIFPVLEQQFFSMLETARTGQKINGIKIGVLCDKSHAEIVSTFISSIGISECAGTSDNMIPVVIDPVISAKNNTRLLNDKGLQTLIDSILPLTTVATPNIEEAAIMTGRKIYNLDDMKECAKVILNMGTKAVVVKGGHLEGNPIDLLYDGINFSTIIKKRLEKQIHGTGCTFSSALTAFLAHGKNVKDAFEMAEKYMEGMLNRSYMISDNGYYYMSSASLQPNPVNDISYN